jgi:hypothetical protein
MSKINKFNFTNDYIWYVIKCSEFKLKRLCSFENETCENYLECMGFAGTSAKAYNLNQLTPTFGLKLTKLSQQ